MTAVAESVPFAADWPAVAAAVSADLAREGVSHGAGAGAHLVRVDPVPRVFDGQEWDALAAGLRQRVAALEAFVADAHGERRAFAAGVVPDDLLDGCPWWEPAVAELPPPARWIPIAGPDVVRGADGRLVVLEDNLRTPTLMALAVVLRQGLHRHLEVRARPFVEPLRDALLALVPDGARTVILGRDPGNAASWEIEALGRFTGWPVVGPEEIGDVGADVVWRRTSEERLAPFGDRLRERLAAGTLQVINPFGTGVADDKRTYCYVDDLVRYFCGEEPLLPSLPSWDLATEAGRAAARERLGEVVLKPRFGSGGHGVVLAPTEDQLGPGWIAQERVAFSTHPTVVDGALEPRHVDVRPFLVGDRVLDGGCCRFAPRGDLAVNLSQGGGGKDVWVVD